MRYGLSRWEGLGRFLDDGRIEIGTNTVERSIRPIALNRKNAPFAGSDEGGVNWAIIASLIETAKPNGVNPHAWLADTLTTLVNRWPEPSRWGRQSAYNPALPGESRSMRPLASCRLWTVNSPRKYVAAGRKVVASWSLGGFLAVVDLELSI
jgi:hypothetical protein